MCNFLSAIVLRNGDLKWHAATDSHSELVAFFELPDNSECRHFAKVEFTPPTDANGVPDYAALDKYTLRVDELTEPAWFAEFRNGVEAKCRALVKSMIVDDAVPLVLDGCRIVVNGGSIGTLKQARAVVSGGTVQSVGSGGTVQSVGEGANVPDRFKPVAAGGAI